MFTAASARPAAGVEDFGDEGNQQRRHADNEPGRRRPAGIPLHPAPLHEDDEIEERHPDESDHGRAAPAPQEHETGRGERPVRAHSRGGRTPDRRGARGRPAASTRSTRAARSTAAAAPRTFWKTRGIGFHTRTTAPATVTAASTPRARARRPRASRRTAHARSPRLTGTYRSLSPTSATAEAVTIASAGQPPCGRRSSARAPTTVASAPGISGYTWPELTRTGGVSATTTHPQKAATGEMPRSRHSR